MVEFVALPYCQDYVQHVAKVIMVRYLVHRQQGVAVVAIEIVGEGTDSVGKNLSSLGTNELVDFALMTMTSMVQYIALQVEWMGSTEYWGKNIEEGTDCTYYSKN